MKNLILFTNLFPYDGVTEQSFILPEIPFLSQNFDRVIIVPQQIKGTPLYLEKDNIHVNVEYALMNREKSMFRLLKNLFTLNGILSFCFDFKRIRSKIQVGYYLILLEEINIYRKWFKKFLKEEQLDISKTIFYTYWFDTETIGLALSLKNNLSLKIITRAHGYDVYDQRVSFRSYYFRNKAMKSVSMIFTASMHAQYYLQTKYPKYTSKIVTQYLGTLKKEDGITLAHCDNNITFLSCSRMHPIKRVPLLSSFIIDFALQLPDFFVKWIHIGDGEDRDSVESIISRIPSNLIVELKGELPNDEVHKIYKNTVIDWTLLTSISEGGCPIAIVESLCYGVPVIATSVGGIPEIVNSNNGILLTDNPTSSEFVAKIKPFIENKELYNKLKQQTTKDYYDKFDANKNHLEFIKQIEKIY